MRRPARTLIDCSWHSPESRIIPTGICLALEKGVKFLLPITKTKDISLASTQCGSSESGRDNAGLSGFLFSIRQPCCVPGRLLPLLVFSGACLFPVGKATGDSGFHWCSVCFILTLVSFLLTVLLHFVRLIRAEVGG